MANIKNKISGLLPDKVKAIIRPYYRAKQLKWPVFDRPSTLRIGSFGGFEVAYREGTTDETVIAHSFDHDRFFSEVQEYQPACDHVIIDVGAHIGTFSLLASCKVQRGKVYAIEPCEDSFNFLRINVALNRAANISVHRLALIDREGTCKLSYDTGNWGHSVVKQLSIHGETVKCCTLADFLEGNGVSKCHFLKLNCEGSEFPILLSTPSNVLQRFEIILVLYHCDLWNKNTRADLLSYLQSSGFNVITRNAGRERGWIIAINNASPLADCNGTGVPLSR